MQFLSDCHGCIGKVVLFSTGYLVRCPVIRKTAHIPYLSPLPTTLKPHISATLSVLKQLLRELIVKWSLFTCATAPFRSGDTLQQSTQHYFFKTSNETVHVLTSSQTNLTIFEHIQPIPDSSHDSVSNLYLISVLVSHHKCKSDQFLCHHDTTHLCPW